MIALVFEKSFNTLELLLCLIIKILVIISWISWQVDKRIDWLEISDR